MKLLEHIYQVGGPGLSHRFDAACYLLKAAEGYWLIDCGTPEGYGQIKENISKLGIEIAQIKKIFATHGHYDHVGAARLFREEYGCRLYLHENDREQVEMGDPIKTSAALLYGTVPAPCQADGLLREGDRWEGAGFILEVMETPGHTMGSVSFIISTRDNILLIAGDSIWGGFSQKIGSNEEIWRASLQKIISRHYDFYSFGHINPVLLADADARLKEAVQAFANYYNPWFKTFHEEYRY